MRIDRADSEAELLGAPASSADIVKVVAGDFEVRLAENAAEIDAAQARADSDELEEIERVGPAHSSEQLQPLIPLAASPDHVALHRPIH